MCYYIHYLFMHIVQRPITGHLPSAQVDGSM